MIHLLQDGARMQQWCIWEIRTTFVFSVENSGRHWAGEQEHLVPTVIDDRKGRSLSAFEMPLLRLRLSLVGLRNLVRARIPRSTRLSEDAQRLQDFREGMIYLGHISSTSPIPGRQAESTPWQSHRVLLSVQHPQSGNAASATAEDSKPTSFC